MESSEFRDKLAAILHENNATRYNIDMSVAQEPDEFTLALHDAENDWSYYFAGTSWVAILAAVQAGFANGDLDDPKEKHPEFYD